MGYIKKEFCIQFIYLFYIIHICMCVCARARARAREEGRLQIEVLKSCKNSS